MRAPRRLGIPAKQRNSPGSGPAGPETFGYFPSLESSPPAGGISPKKRNRGFAAAAASFFLSDQKETKESPGADSPCQGEMSRSDRGGRDRGFRERLSANALVFHEPLSPGPPFFTGEPKGCLGTCGRRGGLWIGILKLSLPLCSIDKPPAPTRYNAPKWCNIHRGRWSAGGWGHPPLHPD